MQRRPQQRSSSAPPRSARGELIQQILDAQRSVQGSWQRQLSSGRSWRLTRAGAELAANLVAIERENEEQEGENAVMRQYLENSVREVDRTAAASP